MRPRTHRLNIEKGSGRYRVFLKKTPDGVLPEPKELFTDGIYSSMRNKLWGENSSPVTMHWTVTDGCMERDIPDAEILRNAQHTQDYLGLVGAALDSRLRTKKTKLEILSITT